LLLPAVVQLIKAGVALDAVLGHRADEILTGFCIFLCLNPTAFRCVSTIFFRLFLLVLGARMRTKDGWSA